MNTRMLHRLYLTAATLAFLLGFGLSTTVIAVYAHDNAAGLRLARCLRTLQAAELERDRESQLKNMSARGAYVIGLRAWWNDDWGEKCRATYDQTSMSQDNKRNRIFSKDAWASAWVTPSLDAAGLGYDAEPEWADRHWLVAIAWLPFFLLVLLRGWFWWLTREPQR